MPVRIAFVLFPDFQQLDIAGPLAAFEVAERIRPGSYAWRFVARQPGLVRSSSGLAWPAQGLPRHDRFDMLMLSGGDGVDAAEQDTTLMRWLRRCGTQPGQRITSVCSGSLMLAAAGLLDGRAACHWAWRDLLSSFDGVTPDPGRVVRDGKVITGGGVTAGIDMALTLMAELSGAAVAQSVQLGIEYAPAPPFDCGRPERADPAVVAAVRQRLEALRPDRHAAAQRAAAALRAG